MICQCENTNMHSLECAGLKSTFSPPKLRHWLPLNGLFWSTAPLSSWSRPVWEPRLLFACLDSWRIDLSHQPTSAPALRYTRKVKSQEDELWDGLDRQHPACWRRERVMRASDLFVERSFSFGLASWAVYTAQRVDIGAHQSWQNMAPVDYKLKSSKWSTFDIHASAICSLICIL